MAKNIDWISVEGAYRAGVMPLREIGSAFGVSEAAVRKKAKQNNWPRSPNLVAGVDLHTKEGFIYLLSITDTAGCKFYKIGMAKILNQRLDNIQGCLPFELDVECAYFTYNRWAEELFIHKKFSKKKVRGEWFFLDDEDVKFIASRSLVSGQKNG